MFGATLTTQWIDWTQMATSNAVQWTVASAMPTVEMAVCEGFPGDASGHAAPYMGYVMRFELL